MALTAKRSVVVTYLLDKLVANKVALGLETILRGDTRLVPTFPAALVRSGPMRRTYATTRKYGIDFRVFVTLMYGRVGEDQINELEVEELAESVEDLFHTDRTLGVHPDNLVINSWIEAVDPGVRLIETAQIKATRLTWRAESREDF